MVIMNQAWTLNSLNTLYYFPACRPIFWSPCTLFYIFMIAMVLVVNNHRYFIVQIETRVYIAVGKVWLAQLFGQSKGSNLEREWWRQRLNKQKDTNVLWLFLLLGLKWPKHGSACIFCVLQKGQSFVYLFGRDTNIDEWTAPKDIYNQSQYLALHKMFSIYSLWLKTAVIGSQENLIAPQTSASGGSQGSDQ